MIWLAKNANVSLRPLIRILLRPDGATGPEGVCGDINDGAATVLHWSKPNQTKKI